MTTRKKHPLDHDGDGRPGGSLPKPERGKAPAAAEAAASQGAPATEIPAAGEVLLFSEEQIAEIRRLALEAVRAAVSRRALRGGGE